MKNEIEVAGARTKKSRILKIVLFGVLAPAFIVLSSAKHLLRNFSDASLSMMLLGAFGFIALLWCVAYLLPDKKKLK
jgi:hypothetical protein